MMQRNSFFWVIGFVERDLVVLEGAVSRMRWECALLASLGARRVDIWYGVYDFGSMNTG